MKAITLYFTIAFAVASFDTAAAPADSPEPEGEVMAGRILSCGRLQATVSIHPVTGSGPAFHDTRDVPLDSAGRFQLRVPQAGVYRVFLSEPGGETLAAVVPVTRLTVLPPVHPAGCGEPAAEPWHSPEDVPESPRDERVISGRVFEMNPQQTPLPNALLWTRAPVARAVRTDKSGNYKLLYPRTGKFLLWAHAPGYRDIGVPARTDSGAGPVAGPIFPLSPAIYLRGQVVDERGNPQPARIEAIRQTASPLADIPSVKVDATAYTDSHGHFDFAVNPDTSYRLDALGEGSLKAHVGVSTPPPDKAAPPLIIRLEEPASAIGELLDAAGLPVQGAIVTLVPENAMDASLLVLAGRRSTAGPHRSAVTNRAGEFRLEGLEPGRYALAATSSDFEPLLVPGVEIHSQNVDLGALYLSRGASIEGWIEDVEGRPLDQAEIGIGFLGQSGTRVVSSSSHRAVSDERGRFQISNLRHGEKVHLFVQRHGYLPTTVTADTAVAGEPIVIALQRAGEVSGVVVDEQREPIVGARVKLQPNSAGPSDVRRIGARGGAPTSALTDDNGHFEIRNVEVGAATLMVSAPEHLPSNIAVTVPEGEAGEEIEIVLKAGATLAGRVLRSDGTPVDGVKVSGGGQTTRSRSDGRFTLRGVPQHRLTLQARHPGLGSLTTEADPAAGQPVEVVFDEAATLEIRARDGKGRALSNVWVSISGGSDPFPRFGRTDSDGTLRFSLEPGVFAVEGRKEGHQSMELSNVSLGPSDHQTRRLVLDTGLAVVGKITGADPTELVGAEVVAGRPEGAGVSGLVESTGDYRISGLAPGSWRVVATLRDGRRAETNVNVDASDGPLEADLELGVGEELSGRAEMDGEPLSGAWITISSFGGSVLARTQAGADGTFSVPGLTESRVQVDLSSPSGDIRVSVPARLGDEVQIDIRTGSIGGLVVNASTGEWIQHAAVLLEPLGDSTRLARTVYTDPEGRFGPIRVPEGRYLVTVDHPGHLRSSAEVTIGAPQQELILPLEPSS